MLLGAAQRLLSARSAVAGPSDSFAAALGGGPRGGTAAEPAVRAVRRFALGALCEAAGRAGEFPPVALAKLLAAATALHATTRLHQRGDDDGEAGGP